MSPDRVTSELMTDMAKNDANYPDPAVQLARDLRDATDDLNALWERIAEAKRRISAEAASNILKRGGLLEAEAILTGTLDERTYLFGPGGLRPLSELSEWL